jgi:DNA-binding GntR family transcriptional regulator
MSCIRFNTPAQLAQLRSMAPAMLTVEQAAALHPSPEITPAKIARLRLLATDSNPKIRESVASSHHTPEDIFFALARDGNEGVRSCVARNASAPRDVLRLLADDPSERVRGFLAVNFAVPNDAMELLTNDSSTTVRELVRWKSELTSV